MKASAPNWLATGFQTVPKIPHPSALNHGTACWVVETAIRMRITSTSRPDASAMIWKVRSPSGRRSDRGRADPAGTAGPARGVTVLTITSRPGPLASRSPRPRSLLVRLRQGGHDAGGLADLAANLAELRLGLLVQAGGQRCVVQLGEQLLAVSQQVADVRLEHLGGIRARLLLVDQNPGLIGDRVRLGAGRPDRAERQVGLDGGVVGGGGGRRGRWLNIVAGLVLDRSPGQPGGLGVGVVHVADGPRGGLDDLRHPAVGVAAAAGGGPVDGRVAAELPDARRALDQELGEVLGGARRVRAAGDDDRGAGQLETGV